MICMYVYIYIYVYICECLDDCSITILHYGSTHIILYDLRWFLYDLRLFQNITHISTSTLSHYIPMIKRPGHGIPLM